ncbi:4'-phosphopantetheinyl transferase family protein [Francisella frigiditurris]|uniref:4'-phosphopantetheinyl transferase superfamily protein n=1 Tax=Francisella frigiditurris TaxID=1542390 RepID=A0A1J0KV60_9GAMM|nr:4'-phosphopantetheinyl transferase superfamily protein [Francisella frigiditurris]APC97704.1 4'-phosphopantetheinyl transferase superfamily protein [Francisella frigiditurris]
MKEVYSFILKIDDFSLENLQLNIKKHIPGFNDGMRSQKIFSQLVRYHVFYNFFSIQNLKFGELESGKPTLINKELEFSISHTSEYIIMSVAKDEIGVDIEQVRDKRNLEKIAFRFFSKLEYEQLRQSSNYKNDFFVLWTLKEAEVKKSGLGISKGFKDACFIKNLDGKWISPKFEQDFLTFLYDDLVGTVCCNNINSLSKRFFRITKNFEFEEVKVSEVL